MTAEHTAFVWTKSTAKGGQKLVLLALADHANRHGDAELSLRDIATLCGLSKSRVEELIRALSDLGEVAVMSTGGGRGNPARYRLIMPDAAPIRLVDTDPDCIPDKPGKFIAYREPSDAEIATRAAPYVHTAPVPRVTDTETGRMDLPSSGYVDRVRDAAGIKLDSEQPFYWNRQEHRHDLAAILKKHNLTYDQLIDRLKDSVGAGRKLDRQPRRLTEIEPLLKPTGRSK